MSIATANLAKMDRELFSELVHVERPVQPALLYTQPLRCQGLGPNFVLFSWRRMRQTNAVFKALQANLFANGYTLRECCAKRLGKVLITHILKVLKDLKRLKSIRKRKERKERWVKVLFNEDEVESMPSDVVKVLVDRIKELKGDNAELTAKLGEQSAEIFEAMDKTNALQNDSGANRGKTFLEVGLQKQQKRKLENIRYTRATAFIVSVSVVVKVSITSKLRTVNFHKHKQNQAGRFSFCSIMAMFCFYYKRILSNSTNKHALRVNDSRTREVIWLFYLYWVNL